MPPSIGDQLGPYKILAAIGAGGMGEVWKALDTRLDRVVAIKTSKSQFSERFAREAKAIAALNHPNICQLYDVGPDYLVMEYVHGAPPRGPLPAEKALEYAGQILGALDAAHRKGIIHRDLKPNNILVTKQHGIKLLDFGLARIAAASADSTVTQPGEKMGTPAYMAPEQWEGKPGDARTDIYCFGCVLYEMLTGKRAAQDRARVEPAPLDSILRTCLEQDPEDRWQSAADIRRALVLPLVAPTVPGPKPSRIWQWVAVAALGTLGVVAFLGFGSSRAPTLGEPISFQVYPPEKTVFSTPLNTTLNVPQFALSPDGGTIAFFAGVEGERPLLWRRALRDVAAQVIPGTDGGQDPFWSPDGRWIGFFADGKVKKTPAAGGAVQVVDARVTDVRGGAWGNDSIIFANGNDPIKRVPGVGGWPATMRDATVRFPTFLPDLRRFLYLKLGSQTGLYAGSLDDTRERAVAQINSSAVYAPPKYLLFVEGDTLFGQAFDEGRLETSGQPFLVAEHVGRSSGFKSAISASTTGAIAYAGTLSPSGSLTWFDRSGQRLGSIGPEGFYTDFRLSPDDKSVAYSLLDPKTSVVEIWITDLTRASHIRLASAGAILNATPIWSPDGSQLVFRKNGSGELEFRRRSAGGAGEEEVVLSNNILPSAGIQSRNLVNTDWAPDERNILFSVPGAESGPDLWLLPLTGDRKPVKLLATPAAEMHGNFSPDGHLFAYTSDESGKFQVYVQTLPLSDKKWQVSTSGGYEPRWRADGREIYYLSEDRKLVSVAVRPGPSFAVPKPLFQTRVPVGVSGNRMHYVPSRDGQRFLVNTQSAEAPQTPITVVLNWVAGLKK